MTIRISTDSAIALIAVDAHCRACMRRAGAAGGGGAAADSKSGGAHRLDRLLGFGRHRGLALPHGHARAGRLPGCSDDAGRASKSPTPGIPPRKKRPGISASPTERRRCCACRNIFTSPGRTTRPCDGHRRRQADPYVSFRRLEGSRGRRSRCREIRWPSGKCSAAGRGGR